MAQTLNDFLQEPTDYSVYRLNAGERALAFVIGFVVAVIVMQVFFGNIIFDVICGIGTGIAFQPLLAGILKKRRKNKLLTQFKDMLDSLNTSYSVGKNTMGAFQDAMNDMSLQYGANSYIGLELGRINIGLANVSSIEDLLADFAQRSGLEDVRTFADVFYSVNRRGGNIKSVISETKSIICEKIEIEQEIETVTSASKNSLYVIMVMPLLIVPVTSGFMEDTSPIVSILTKLGAIVLFVVAFLIGNKITDIKF